MFSLHKQHLLTNHLMNLRGEHIPAPTSKTIDSTVHGEVDNTNNDESTVGTDSHQPDSGSRNNPSSDNYSHAVVHMGPHKTGSTTIQFQSQHLQDHLKLDGFEMPWSVMRERTERETFGRSGGRNQLRFAFCFSSFFKEHMEKCDPQLLDYGRDIAARDKNLFVSSEQFSFINDTGVEELAQYLSQWQKQTIVVFYRRYHDWIVSEYNENTKKRTLNDTFEWESSILDRVYDRINNVPVIHITKLEERLRKRFDNVLVMNFHDHSKGGPDTTLFCEPALNMNHTCKAIQNEKDPIHANGGINLDYTDLAYGAKKSGLVKIETNKRMQQVAQAMQDHHMHVLNGTVFKRVCPPQEDLDRLLNMSLTFELMYFPNQVDTLKSDFDKLATTKLCKVDVDQTLEEKRWRDFVVSLSTDEEVKGVELGTIDVHEGMINLVEPPGECL